MHSNLDAQNQEDVVQPQHGGCSLQERGVFERLHLDINYNITIFI